MADQHVLLPGCGELGPVPRDWGVRVQLAAVYEHERRQASHGLRRRPDVGNRVSLPRNGAVFVAVAAPDIDCDVAVKVHNDRGSYLGADVHVALKLALQRAETLVAGALDVSHLCHVLRIAEPEMPPPEDVRVDATCPVTAA